MSIFQDFCFELDSQMQVVRYIEISFEEEFKKASRILDAPLRPVGDVYSDNAEFISELKSKFDNAKNTISTEWQDAEEYPEWLYRVDKREALGELIEYCVDCIDNGETVDAEKLNSEIAEWNVDNRFVVTGIYHQVVCIGKDICVSLCEGICSVCVYVE